MEAKADPKAAKSEMMRSLDRLIQVVGLLLPHLTEEEMAYYRRGKNSHVHAVPKGATPAQYAKATGLEALFGALYLSGQTDRLNERFHRMMEE